MSVQLLCPACGVVTEVRRAPVERCPHCGAELPEALRASTERALANERAPRPLLLTLGQWWALFTGAILLLLVTLAPFDAGTFMIDGEGVSGPEFFRRAGWLFALVGGALLAIAVGLFRRRAWVRPLMVLYWFGFALMPFVDARPTLADFGAAVLLAAIGAAASAWYLYRKANVRAWFESRGND